MQPSEDRSVDRRQKGFRRARALTLAVAGASLAGAVVIADVAAHTTTTSARTAASATTATTSGTATTATTATTSGTATTTYSAPAASSSTAHVSSGAS